MGENDNKLVETEMRHRQITLADGRYMIFYTFDSQGAGDVEENQQGEDVRASL